MNILFLISSLGAGGAERVASTLCNAWVGRGNLVTLVPTFSGGGSSFYVLDERVELVYLAQLAGPTFGPRKRYLRRIMGLRRLIRARRPDVVISFLPNVNVAAIVATAFTKVPVVISERRDPISQPTSDFWEFACTVFYRFADAVVVQTDSVLRSINGVYPALKRVVCVPNPSLQAVRLCSSADRSSSRRVLLSLGRLASEKQVEHSIEAFAALSDRHGQWDLHIYGDGPARGRLLSLVEELGARERIFFMGKTVQPDDVMAKADAFVMTSRNEGFPNALLEAMATGLPCVVYDCPSGPHEITRGGQDALLIPLNDRDALAVALGRLMVDAKLREDLGCRARVSVLARYELNAVLHQWDEVFKRVGVSV